MYDNMFKNKYPMLKGKNWIQSLSDEDKKIFYELGAAANGYGHIGGVARVKQAKRDNKGRFIK